MPTIVRNQLTSLKNKARRAGWLKWIRTEADEKALLNGCIFSRERGEHVVEFFSKFLRHSKGQWAGKPFDLLPWQRDDVVMPLFGWQRPEGGRRYSKAYCEIPKKNGKSALASGIGLYLLAGDGEDGAEVYSVASDRYQAGIVHREAILMVDASPELSAALEINRSSFNIGYGDTRSFYRALAAIPSSQEGLNAHGIIADEVHVWNGRASWDALKYAFRARRQGLLFAITTAGDDTTSVAYEQRQYSEGVNNGTIDDDRHFGYVRAADPKDDWTSADVWAKANPSLGTIIRIDDFAADVREAEKSPAAQASFKRYSLNIWGSATTPWLDIHRWSECAGTFRDLDLYGRDCYGGLDLAIKRDSTALCLLFPMDRKGGGEWTYRILSHFWLPRATAERQRSIVPWETWERQGFITLTDGDVCDFNFVRRQLQDVAQRFNLCAVAFDRMYAHLLAQQLQDEDGLKMYEFAQTINNFASPTAAFERLVIAGDIEHNANAVMDWQIGNVNVKTDVNNNLRPVKPPDGEHRKIDGPVAAIMALGLAMTELQNSTSVYEEYGNLSL